MPGPRSGPCSPWCDGADIEALPAVAAAITKALASGVTQPAIDAICATSAIAASEVLYELSGRVYTGACGPETVRPVSRPSDADTRSLAGGSPLGWFSAFGSASSYGAAPVGVLAHYATEDPPTIRLPYPVTEITQVKIDGTVIPSDEYELRGFKELVRMRVSASSSPTARWGWPTSQIPDLPDTEAGTFSVTFMFGAAPPQMGVLAAVKLGEYLAMPQLGDSTHYPKGTRQMTRQGVTTQVASTIDILEKGSLGIWEVDAFILSVNPRKLQRQSAVWSPDIGRPRRQANPSS
jgi:hypothetical protein